jgi:hypothetical protein
MHAHDSRCGEHISTSAFKDAGKISGVYSLFEVLIYGMLLG